MFASQADPFLHRSNTFAAAEKRHHGLRELENEREHVPEIIQPQSNKRPLRFEPEFIAALDSTLVDSSSFSQARPNKKIKRYGDMFGKSIPRSSITPPTVKSPVPIVGSPSIIDLSTGEELVTFRLGENEHKRRRESECEAAVDLREVFDVQEDGSLHPVMDHAPTFPSPSKKVRLGDSNLHPKAPRFDKVQDSTRIFKNPRADWYRDNIFTKQRSDHEDCTSDNEDSAHCRSSGSSVNSMALIKYEGPKTVTISDGVSALMAERLATSLQPSISLDKVQGHELVLYQKHTPMAAGCLGRSITEKPKFGVLIEELDDEDDLESPSEVSSQADSLIGLEAKIMKMEI
ncbi:hypothetical protein BG004_005361 [Podila humilis]|nr:hypothetical protein BG004_005361 [Podila humilis]